MSGVAAAVAVGTAVVTTGAQMYSSSKANKAQKNALNQQGETSQGNFNDTSALYSPYVTSGTNALNRLQTGTAKPMTEEQFTKANQAYQVALNDWNSTEARYNTMKAQYNQLDQNGKNAVGNSPEGMVEYFDKALADKYKAGKPSEPTNEGRGEFSQLANMTPQDYFAAEAAAGRPVSAVDQNWNANFDQASYLASQGKSPTALNDNFNTNAHLKQFGKSEADMYKDFSMNDWLTAQGKDPNALVQNFDQAGYLASQGRSADALNQNFDQNAYLVSQGKQAGDLNANFDQAAYLASQGRSVVDLNANFDMGSWLQSQGRSTNALTRDFAMSDYQEDPAYKFRLDQGNRSLEASAASRGTTLSGATLKALSAYNQGEASQEYQNSVTRYNVNRNNLQSVAYNAQGQFGTDRGNLIGNTNQAASQFGQNRANLVSNTANASSQFERDRGNLISNTTNAANQFGQDRSQLTNVAYNAQGQFIGDRSNLVANVGNASNQFTNDRANLISNVGNEFNRFNTNQNKLYGKFVDAYGRQSGAKQTDFSNIYGLSNQGLQATYAQAQAGQTNADNQMGVQAGIGNAQVQQSNSNANAISGLAGTVGGVAANYFKNQPLSSGGGTSGGSSSGNALTGYTPYQSPNYRLY